HDLDDHVRESAASRDASRPAADADLRVRAGRSRSAAQAGPGVSCAACWPPSRAHRGAPGARQAAGGCMTDITVTLRENVTPLLRKITAELARQVPAATGPLVDSVRDLFRLR